MSAALVVTLCVLSALVGYWVGYRRAQELSDELVDSADEVVAHLRTLADEAERKIEGKP